MRKFSEKLILVVLVLLAFNLMPPKVFAGACNCKITDASGSATLGSTCTLFKVLAYEAPSCTTGISFDDSLAGKTISVDVPISLKGVSLSGPATGKVTLQPSSSFVGDVLVDLSGGGSKLQGVTIEAPGKTAIQTNGTNNHIEAVTIIGAATAIEAKGAGLAVSGGSITGNTVGVSLLGTNTIISGVTFDHNTTAIKSINTAQSNHFVSNSFTGNTSAVILNGANGSLPPPIFMRAIKEKGATDKFTLLVLGLGNTVKAYTADAAAAAQGKTELGTAQKIAVTGVDVWYDWYRINISGVTPLTEFVLIMDGDFGTTEFSKKFKIGDLLDVASDACASTAWFLNSASKAYSESSKKSVWLIDLDSDGFNNAVEDKNQDCVISTDMTQKESDPSCGAGKTSSIPGAVCVPAIDDVDGDLVDDAKDNCPKVANANQKDSDANGVGDACDDKDQDGYTVGLSDAPAATDKIDNCPGIYNPDQSDSNADGKGDACADDDSDGSLGDVDNCPIANADQVDTDGDSIGDVCDADDDNDGLTDAQEGVAGTLALSPDTDKDGFCDGPGFGYDSPKTAKNTCIPLDNCPLVKNADQRDSDEDGVGNGDFDSGVPNCDKAPYAAKSLDDSDTDGAIDSKDNCIAIKNQDQADFDNDGVGDVCDSDDDNDGILDVYELQTRYRYYSTSNSKSYLGTLNPLNADSDGDGFCDGAGPGIADANGVSKCFSDGNGKFVADGCPAFTLGTIIADCINGALQNFPIYKSDIDQDGILNEQDNCPALANPDQSNMDGNGVGDACDDDIDGDGLKNWLEDAQHTFAWDKDSDHFKEGFKVIGGFTYDGFWDGNAKGDTDKCPANYHIPNEDFCNAAAGANDADIDGVTDANDNCPQQKNADQADLDKDKVGDVCDTDDDGDGVLDAVDNCPLASNANQSNIDKDGAGDVCDKCPSDAGNVCVNPSENTGTGNQNTNFGPGNQSVQGGWGSGGCSLTPGTPSVAPDGLMVLMISVAMIGALRLRRSCN